MTDTPTSAPACLIGHRDASLLRDETLAGLFAATVARTPDALAVTDGCLRLTYAQLAARAARVSAGLAARGIGPGDFVGLWFTRSVDLHVALLGILGAGAAYLPFDAEAPPERVATCLADCRSRLTLVDAATRQRAGTTRLPSPALTLAEVEAEPAGALADARPDDPAYAIYTSGSTGTPKGIVISHRAICHYLRAANTVYGLVAEDRVFQSASVAFDLSLEEIFVPYLVGASLFVAGPRALAETDRLPDLLEREGITVLDTVPTLLGLLGRDVPGLRVVILGGEACPPALAERWCRPGRRLFNSYGPTETSVVATVAEIQPGRPVTIGRPIPNYACWVADEDLAPLPAGRVGELLIGGPGLAQGYLPTPRRRAAPSASLASSAPHGWSPASCHAPARRSRWRRCAPACAGRCPTTWCRRRC